MVRLALHDVYVPAHLHKSRSKQQTSPARIPGIPAAHVSSARVENKKVTPREVCRARLTFDREQAYIPYDVGSLKSQRASPYERGELKALMSTYKEVEVIQKRLLSCQPCATPMPKYSPRAENQSNAKGATNPHY